MSEMQVSVHYPLYISLFLGAFFFKTYCESLQKIKLHQYIFTLTYKTIVFSHKIILKMGLSYVSHNKFYLLLVLTPVNTRISHCKRWKYIQYFMSEMQHSVHYPSFISVFLGAPSLKTYYKSVQKTKLHSYIFTLTNRNNLTQNYLKNGSGLFFLMTNSIFRCISAS